MCTPVKARLYRHPHGIAAVDTEYLYPGHAAAHIIVESGRAAFVDVGTNFSVPYLLAALGELGLAREAVDYVRAVYGARLEELYGELLPIPAERVRVVEDGERLSLAGRTLEFLHTPGHALHHYVVVDAAHASIFSGDTFGISYRALDTERGAFITPTTPPSQFDPGQHVASIERLLGLRPESVYLMHFSRVTGIPRLGESLKRQVLELARIAQAHAGDADPAAGIRAAMLALWLELLRRHGSRLTDEAHEEILANDLELNTQGLMVWLERIRRR